MRPLMFWTPLLSIALLASPSEADDAVVKRTLTRKLDHVVIEGQELTRALGCKIENLRLLAMSEGKLAVIPFQIDERTPSGNYAFDKGVDTKRDTDQGAFDANDELVFMARDTGDQAPPTLRKAYPGAVEIELLDPKNRGRSWAYLANFSGQAPPLSKKDYVSIELNKDGKLVYRGQDFLVDNARSNSNAVRMTTLRFRGADGKLGTNVVDTTKTRLKCYYFAISIERNGSEMRVGVGAYLDGPVRVIALNVVEIYLIWGFWVRSPDSLIYFYDYGSEMPTNMNVPINLDRDPPSIARLSTDFSPRAKGWSFYNSYNKKPFAIDGKMSSKERSIDKRFPLWNVAYGPEGGLITRLVFEEPQLTKNANSRLYYLDNAKAKDAPEHEDGSWGCMGFDTEISGLATGLHRGVYYVYYRSGFRYGEEQPFLDVIDNPLKITVR